MESPEIIGTSEPIRQALELALRVAPTSLPVLIEGETGTGKELFARLIHAGSNRSQLVVVNCPGLPESLLESEVFGHSRGAFTGAISDKPGLLEEADGGTIFLDEIGDLPPTIQPKLLRALEYGEVRRVGSNSVRSVMVRVIAATNKDLEREVASGRFREDLLARLDCIRLRVPRLVDRSTDILQLLEHFLKGRRLSDRARELLLEYQWPRNVRELRMVINCALALAPPDAEIHPDHLPLRVRQASSSLDLHFPSHHSLKLRDVERSHILKVYATCDHQVSRTAAILGIDRATLRRKLKHYGHSCGNEAVISDRTCNGTGKHSATAPGHDPAPKCRMPHRSYAR